MQYQSASTEMTSPPASVPMVVLFFEAMTLAVVAGLLSWLV